MASKSNIWLSFPVGIFTDRICTVFHEGENRKNNQTNKNRSKNKQTQNTPNIMDGCFAHVGIRDKDI